MELTEKCARLASAVTEIVSFAWKQVRYHLTDFSHVVSPVPRSHRKCGSNFWMWPGNETGKGGRGNGGEEGSEEEGRNGGEEGSEGRGNGGEEGSEGRGGINVQAIVQLEQLIQSCVVSQVPYLVCTPLV